ncbi:heterokaryon incompatibility domain-containing protein [Trichoderma barbatum]
MLSNIQPYIDVGVLTEWIDLCDTTHKCFSHKESSCIHPVETSNGFKGNYIALSHCWGESQKIREDTPNNSLPKSFHGAERVTIALSVPHLWVDSLYIIQEDEKDWESEAAKTYCTIAASTATSSLGGFFGTRNPRAWNTIQTSGEPLYLAEYIDHFHTHVEQSNLRHVCETLATLRNSQSQILGSNFPTSGLKYCKDDHIRLIQHPYRVYGKLHLTKATDRPKAILGLQNQLASTDESRASHGLYERYLERTLLWQAEVPGSLTRISDEKSTSVPSWSCMAFTGEIKYMDIPFNQVNWTGNLQTPFGTEGNDVAWGNRLRAEANQLLIDETEISKRATIDSHESVFDPAKGEVVYYAMLVRSAPGASQSYERVGVGAFLATHISPETESILGM